MVPCGTAMCPHNMLDPLGHHVNLVGLGHNQLRDTFVQTCHFAGVSILALKLEVD